MEKNVGTVDKLVRFVLAAAAFTAILTGGVRGAAAVALGAVAVVLVGTGLMGWCGIYTLLGISTVRCAACDAEKHGDAGDRG